MKKKQIIFKPDQKTIEFEGKIYREKLMHFHKIDGVEHIKNVVFEEFDPKENKEKMEFIKKKLMDNIPKERVIEEVLKEIPTTQLNKIHRLLKNGAKIKRQDGCLGLKIEGDKKGQSANITLFE